MSFFPPPREPLPPGYPLEPIDARGCRIAQGDLVLIPSPLPTWLVHDLPAEDVARLKQREGTVMRILELDAYGFVWFGEEDPWFSLRPGEVLRQSPGPND